MNKERMAYIAPTSELLVVRFEQNIMSPGIDANGIQRGNVINNGDYGFTDWDD